MSTIKKIAEKDFEFTHDIDENPNPNNFFMHTHEGCEFYYFISGKGAFHIEGNKYELKAGDVLIMNNTESHYIQVDPSVPYNRCVVRFEKEFINKIDSQGFLLKMYENRQPGKQNLIETAHLKNDLITLLLNNMVNSSESNTMDFITTFYLILNELNKIFDSHTMISESIKNTVASQIITYILDNVCNEITVS